MKTSKSSTNSIKGIKELDRYTVGCRRKLGVDWAIENVLERHSFPFCPSTWVVVEGLCNGIPDRSESFDSCREARAYFESLRPDSA